MNNSELIAKIEQLTILYEKEKESHKKTMLSYDKRLLGIKKHHDLIFKKIKI